MDYQVLVSNHQLTENESTILKCIQDMVKSKPKVKISDIADSCFVSPASVVKLAKKLGYHGFSELAFDLSNKFNVNSDIDFANYTGLSSLETGLLVTETAKLLNRHKTHPIMIIGTGFGMYAADYMTQKLIIFGRTPIRPLHYETFDNEFPEPGIIIAISESGASQGKIGTVSKATQKGCSSLCFTSDKDSPLASICDLVIPVKSTKSHHSHYTPNLFVAKTLTIFELILTKLSALESV